MSRLRHYLLFVSFLPFFFCLGNLRTIFLVLSQPSLVADLILTVVPLKATGPAWNADVDFGGFHQPVLPFGCNTVSLYYLCCLCVSVEDWSRARRKNGQRYFIIAQADTFLAWARQQLYPLSETVQQVSL